MYTQANIVLYDLCEAGQGKGRRIFWKEGAILHHAYWGFPSWMGPKLDSLLQKTRQELQRTRSPQGWNSKRVAEMIQKLSSTDRPFDSEHPCIQANAVMVLDIDYLWRIYLSSSKEDQKPAVGKYKIKCFRVLHDWHMKFQAYKPVNWRKEVKCQQRR
jgi:hypothetical protein